MPVIASHRINDPQVAREMLTDGSCDMVTMGRALIADTVVLAAGTVACNPLTEELEEKGIICHVICDAKKPAMVFEAVHQGHAVGNKL